MSNFMYILDEQGNPVVEHDSLVWSKWFENTEARIIGRDFISYKDEQIHVSTVFLGIPHPSFDSDKMMMYETMVFAPDEVIDALHHYSEDNLTSIMGLMFSSKDIQRRYETRQQAEQRHKGMVAYVHVVLLKMAQQE